jgi:hypothetical protein
MSNARVILDMSANGQAVPTTRGGKEVPTMWYNAEEGNLHRMLKYNRNPRTLWLLFMRRRSISSWGWHTLEEYLVEEK